MATSSSEEGRGHLVTLEELVHQFGTRTKAREDYLVHQLIEEASQRALVTVEAGGTRHQLTSTLEALHQQIDQLEAHNSPVAQIAQT